MELTGSASIRLSAGLSLKKTFLWLTGTAACLASQFSHSQTEPWCHINPNHSLPGNTGAAVQISRENILPVKSALQARAQEMLRDVDLLEISFQNANSLVNNIELTNHQFSYYLVRASAVYDNSRDLSSLAFAATAFTDTHTLNVYSFALKNPETKLKNLALVIKTTTQLKSENSICETAF